jgi:hypothetical protein
LLKPDDRVELIDGEIAIGRTEKFKRGEVPVSSTVSDFSLKVSDIIG